MSTTTLPPCPTQNRNVALLGAANRCRLAGMTTAQAEAELERWLSRTAKRGEIERAVARAYDTTPSHAKHRPGQTHRVSVNAERKEAVLEGGPGIADLWEASPIRFEDEEPHTAEILRALFPGNPLLCFGKYIPDADGATDHHTRPRELWNRPDLWELIVPSPMSAIYGTTKEGKQSEHSLENTGPRRFLVCEFDQGTADEHAGLLWHLGCFAPLVLALSSAGKSIHGWFYVAGWTEEKALRFFQYAVSIGADPATWTRSQFVRMPDGTRGSNGKRQTVYYYNPEEVK